MATYEKNGKLTYVDEQGNEYVLFPKTKIENVDGLLDSLHIYRGPYTGDINRTDLNGLYWIVSANCTGTFPENKYAYYFLDACERKQKLIAYTDNGIGRIEERYYTNSQWYPWKKTDAINSVPTARKINEKALTSDITLSASDVGARPNTWMPTASDVGAAPAGFGLGTAASKSVDSVKNINAAGWWLTKGDTPDGGNWFCLPRIVNSGNDMVIDAWSFNGLYNAKINKSTSKGWGEWEWVNPPMEEGVEYRTTERFMGKPVYRKCVRYGPGPNNTSKTEPHGIQNVGIVLEWHCYNINSGSNVEFASSVEHITVSQTAITMKTNANEAAWLINFIIKYTKTTD